MSTSESICYNWDGIAMKKVKPFCQYCVYNVKNCYCNGYYKAVVA